MASIDFADSAEALDPFTDLGQFRSRISLLHLRREQGRQFRILLAEKQVEGLLCSSTGSAAV